MPIRLERLISVRRDGRVAADSSLPDDLRALGYEVREDGDGERILQHAIVELFTRRADGELEPAETGTHAGICTVKRFAFDMP